MSGISNKCRNRVFLILAFFLPLIWLFALRCVTLRDGDNALDAYYHAGMAQHGPGVYMAKEFPWTQISVWNRTFADKELLYHAALDLGFRVQRGLGLSDGPPFHFAAMMFLAFAMAGWIFAATRMELPAECVFAGSFLFCFMSPNYLYRLMMLRPHVMSIGFFFFMIGFLAKGSFRFRLIAVAVLSFIYAWSYSNPHFIVLIPLAFAVAGFFRDRWKGFLFPAVSFAVVVTACLCHPQTPNYLKVWKIQGLDALLNPMMTGIQVPKPTEMLPPSFMWVVNLSAMLLTAYVCLFLMIRLLERVGIRRFPVNAGAVALPAFLFTFGTFAAMRSVEYASPLLALLLPVLYKECIAAGVDLPFSKTRYGQAGILLAAALLFGTYSSLQFNYETPKGEVRELKQISAWLKKNVPAGETVVNLDWSDFPLLFYSDDTHRYLWGMDPMFSLTVNPEKVALLTRTRPDTPLKYVTSPNQLMKSFNARYAVLLWPRTRQADFLYRLGWNVEKEFVEKGKEEGWIFSLDERSFYRTGK